MVGSWHGWVRVILEISRLIDSWTFSGPTCFFVYTFVCSFVELCPSKISKCMKADGFMRHGVKKEHQNPSRHFSCSSSRGTRLCINTIVFSPQQITKNMRVCFFWGGGTYICLSPNKKMGVPSSSPSSSWLLNQPWRRFPLNWLVRTPSLASEKCLTEESLSEVRIFVRCWEEKSWGGRVPPCF